MCTIPKEVTSDAKRRPSLGQLSESLASLGILDTAAKIRNFCWNSCLFYEITQTLQLLKIFLTRMAYFWEKSIEDLCS